MREELLSRLAEPGTLAPLSLENARISGGRIEEGMLVSQATGRRYPIRRGIPRFVDSDNYAGSFGMQWNAFRQTQLDSATGRHDSQDRFDSEAGWSEAELKGRWVLDAGCGAGRFAEVAAARGANLVALDFSSAIDAAASTLSRFPNVDLVQASLLEPPFQPASFDYAYCIGVIQHTPDPPRAVQCVVKCVRAGGRFCLTIYGRRPWTKLNSKYLIRPLTRRLPQKVLLKAIETAMPVLFPITDRLFRVPLVGKLAQFAIPVATYVDKDHFTVEQRYQEAILDTFDMLSPRYDSPMTAPEVESALVQAGAQAWQFRSRVPVIVVGTH